MVPRIRPGLMQAFNTIQASTLVCGQVFVKHFVARIVTTQRVRLGARSCCWQFRWSWKCSWTESLLTLIYALAIGLSIGATAMVARRIGEHNPDGAARAAVQAIALGLIAALVIAAIGAPLAPKLLSLMGGSPWVVQQGSGFTRVMLAGNATVVLLFMVNAIFRGAGDAAIAMRVLWLANWINII